MFFVAAEQSEALRATEPILFYLFAAMAVVGALWVVLSQQIVRMAVALLITLGAVAALYFLLEAEFLAAIQLIVYVGGTLILIVFGIMLTSQGPNVRFPVPIGQRVMGWLIGLFAAVIMAVAGVLGLPAWTASSDATTATGHAASSGAMGPTVVHGNEATLQEFGEALISTYVVPLQIAAVLLLIVMIGAAYIAKGRVHELEQARRTGVAGGGPEGGSN